MVVIIAETAAQRPQLKPRWATQSNTTRRRTAHRQFDVLNWEVRRWIVEAQLAATPAVVVGAVKMEFAVIAAATKATAKVKISEPANILLPSH